VVTEALVGAGLVLTGNTADTLTTARPFWMAAHLLNTFVLLAFLTMTACLASGSPPLRPNVEGKYKIALAVGVAAIFIVGITGSLAALASMIFPSDTLAKGIAQDFSATSNALLRLRLLHPISAIIAMCPTAIFGWLARKRIWQ
jgi:cytochrome c oxidase assembly protein subunit 15